MMYSGDDFYSDDITSPLTRPEPPRPTIRERLLAATDHLNATRRAYYQQTATYDDCATAARAVLELRQQAEKAFSGKVKTKIDQHSIASLIRSS